MQLYGFGPGQEQSSQVQSVASDTQDGQTQAAFSRSSAGQTLIAGPRKSQQITSSLIMEDKTHAELATGFIPILRSGFLHVFTLWIYKTKHSRKCPEEYLFSTGLENFPTC